MGAQASCLLRIRAKLQAEMPALQFKEKNLFHEEAKCLSVI